jgi:hypothetical protein
VGFTVEIFSGLCLPNELRTSNCRFWEAICLEDFGTMKAALQREKELESGVFSEKNRFVFTLLI